MRLVTDFRDAYRAVRPSVVGIGLRNDPQFTIFGSATIITPDGWIVTNRHVLEPLLDQREGRIGVRPGSAAFLFVQGEPEDTFVAVAGVVATDITHIGFPKNVSEAQEHAQPLLLRGKTPHASYPALPPDIGLCKIDPDNCHPAALPLKALAFHPSRPVCEGLPVGILGFPQGLKLPIESSRREHLQITPLLQTGVISALLPFSGVPKPDAFVLDIPINPGSSGSPLFLADGEAIGIVYAARQHFSPLTVFDEAHGPSVSEDVGVFMPTSLGLAVPAVRFPESWFDNMFSG